MQKITLSTAHPLNQVLKITPQPGAGAPIVLRWAVNREPERRRRARMAVLGVDCPIEEYVTDVLNGHGPATFEAREYTLQPEYVVTLTPTADGPGTVWIRPVFNHRPDNDGSVISIEFPPDAYTVAANFANEVPRRSNRGPFRNVAAARQPLRETMPG